MVYAILSEEKEWRGIPKSLFQKPRPLPAFGMFLSAAFPPFYPRWTAPVPPPFVLAMKGAGKAAT